MGVLTISKSVSDIVVKRNICKPMQRSEAARQIAMVYRWVTWGWGVGADASSEPVE
jgi:hypothetical protein